MDFRAGFSIGDLAEFTLWTGQGDGLPALPLFGMMPQAVETDWVRIALMCIPLASAFATGMVVMLFNKGFHIRVGESGRNIDVKRVVLSFAIRLLLFRLPAPSCPWLPACCSPWETEAWDRNILRTSRRRDRINRKVGQPTAMGLFSAWLLTLVAVSIFFAIRWMMKRIRERGKRETAPESTENSREETRALRTVASNNNNKEDQGDNNESTDTTGSGISLP